MFRWYRDIKLSFPQGFTDAMFKVDLPKSKFRFLGDNDVKVERDGEEKPSHVVDAGDHYEIYIRDTVEKGAYDYRIYYGDDSYSKPLPEYAYNFNLDVREGSNFTVSKTDNVTYWFENGELVFRIPQLDSGNAYFWASSSVDFPPIEESTYLVIERSFCRDRVGSNPWPYYSYNYMYVGLFTSGGAIYKIADDLGYRLKTTGLVSYGYFCGVAAGYANNACPCDYNGTENKKINRFEIRDGKVRLCSATRIWSSCQYYNMCSSQNCGSFYGADRFELRVYYQPNCTYCQDNYGTYRYQYVRAFLRAENDPTVQYIGPEKSFMLDYVREVREKRRAYASPFLPFTTSSHQLGILDDHHLRIQ